MGIRAPAASLGTRSKTPNGKHLACPGIRGSGQAGPPAPNPQCSQTRFSCAPSFVPQALTPSRSLSFVLAFDSCRPLPQLPVLAVAEDEQQLQLRSRKGGSERWVLCRDLPPESPCSCGEEAAAGRKAEPPTPNTPALKEGEGREILTGGELAHFGAQGGSAWPSLAMELRVLRSGWSRRCSWVVRCTPNPLPCWAHLTFGASTCKQ